MRSNYKRLGDYIERVNVRNSDGQYSRLLGINIDKFFMPSVANVVGTDLTKYKVVQRGQFSCNRMHVGRDGRLPIALSNDAEGFIVSPAYDVFEILNTNELLPEYLMMWFSREEFDRNCWFYTDTDIRGKLGWDSFCDMTLPIPSPEVQQKIVDEYNTVVDRIKLNKKLNKKLEEAAQAVYKHWFVDFEFPDENGNPYKSSGGKMKYSDELDTDIPMAWKIDEISNTCDIGSSKRIYSDEYVATGVPFYRGKEVSLRKKSKSIESPLFITRHRFEEVKRKYGAPEAGDILLTAVGTLGVSWLVDSEEFYFKDGNIIWFNNFIASGMGTYIYQFMQSKKFRELIDEITIGSTQSAITIQSIGARKILVPTPLTLSAFDKILLGINKHSKYIQKEIISNELLSRYLLSSVAAEPKELVA